MTDHLVDSVISEAQHQIALKDTQIAALIKTKDQCIKLLRAEVAAKDAALDQLRLENAYLEGSLDNMRGALRSANDLLEDLVENGI
jgi:hypothetical protein